MEMLPGNIQMPTTYHLNKSYFQALMAGMKERFIAMKTKSVIQ